MGLRVVSLASGSSGNAFLVEAGDTRVLIDAGCSVRALAEELEHPLNFVSQGTGSAGIHRGLTAILLTHEHSDHVSAVSALSRRYSVPVIANERTLAALNLIKAQTDVLATDSVMKIGELRITSFGLPHDGHDPVGYSFEYERWRVCLATDLGYVPSYLRDYVRAADLVILEANHDPDRLINGPYPDFLKGRILGQRGHLSNQQAAECIVQCASDRPQWLWLAHLSAVNNSPRLALRTVRRYLECAGITTVKVEIALRDRRSLVWDAENCWTQPALPFR
ncbi:MAG: MBL fold metallo-hydrolase [Chloroflexi bacterium]|nr:MBL fold metallo-hydrolase [Chloroflexota bacterium]MCL5075315.1 MBL fold metallo-hydrolase [Chloroflexota bacterium]